ncbi:MAG: AraC family transcriptional regulator [Bauldia sp.]
MSADPLSDVLRTVRLTGAVFYDSVAHEPWVAEQPPPGEILPMILPGAEHLIAYHVVTAGNCFGGLIGGEQLPLKGGDVIVFAHGDPHVLSSAPGMRADLDAAARERAAMSGRLPFIVEHPGAGPVAARFVCGYLACDALPFNPLINQLPRVIVARDDGSGWLAQFIRVATEESANRRAGGESVLAKLSELMFIEVVRRHLQSLPAEQAGWLAGLRDPFVGKALTALHTAPAREWTIEDLGHEVGLSRSVLAERFNDLVGVPPMQYLARWRMQIAAGLLAGGRSSIAEIAEEVGYGSEAAFSRAFKAAVGLPPAAWRRRSAATAA